MLAKKIAVSTNSAPSVPPSQRNLQLTYSQIPVKHSDEISANRIYMQYEISANRFVCRERERRQIHGKREGEDTCSTFLVVRNQCH